MVPWKASSSILVLCVTISVTWWFHDLTAPAPPESISLNTLGSLAPAVSLLQHSKSLLSRSLGNHQSSMITRERKDEPIGGFTDLGAGNCILQKGKMHQGKMLHTPNHMHLGTHMKDKCAQYCLDRTAPDSFGKDLKCWGYTITKKNTCYIWREGPLEKFSWESDPSRHCYAVSALLDSPESVPEPLPAPEPPPEPEPPSQPVIIGPGVPHPNVPPQPAPLPPPEPPPEPEPPSQPVIIGPGVPHPNVPPPPAPQPPPESPLKPITREIGGIIHHSDGENAEWDDFGID